MTPLLPLFFALLQSPIDSAVGRFYDARWFDPAPAWVQRSGITRQATALLDVVAHADRDGLDPADYLTPTLDSLLHRDLTFDDAWRLDTLLTRTFFLYARDVSSGRVEPALVDSQWTRAAQSVDLAALLQLALDAEQVVPVLRDAAPSEPGYLALRDALGRYRDIAQHGDWPAALGARLAVEGYDTTVGLPAALVDNGTVAFTARAVVGRPDWPTPIVSSRATHILFRPTWTVPRVIAERELLPLIRRDPDYVTREGFHVFADSQLVQEPGPANPLGGMKLVFWTRFGAFIHDTPSQPLFSERWRAFSHGCVRVEGAAALAGRLLPEWSADSIADAMANGRERWVPLPQPIPVHLVYWTAWVADDGLVAFAADPYGWDEELTRALASRDAQHVTMKRETRP